MRFLQTKWATIPLAILSLFLLVSVLKLLPAVLIAHDEATNLESQLIKYDELAKISSAQEDYYQSDDYFEQQARVKLNYKKPDEKVVFVYKNKSEISQSQETIEVITWWQKFKNWLKK